MAKSDHPSERVIRHDSYRDREAILEPVSDRMSAILSSRFIENANGHAPGALLTSSVPKVFEASQRLRQPQYELPIAARFGDTLLQ